MPFFPPGHYYTPIISDEVIAQYDNLNPLRYRETPGVSLDEQVLDAHMMQMVNEYKILPQFPRHASLDARYYYDNGEHWYFDALATRHFIRFARPKTIVEIGCGYSSAAMMDGVESEHLNTSFVFVEPDPIRLKKLISVNDIRKNTLIEDFVQNVSISLFERLEAGDIVFIDSSHVAKFNSDVNFYLFEILPRLRPGVFIHIHDIGYPFEYAKWMLEQGRMWNEAYMVRAFPTNNSAFQIEFWCAFATQFRSEIIQREMPLCREWPGGSFWMRRMA